MAIRDAYIAFEHSVDDALYTHFLNKRPTEFWKSWNAKFRKHINKKIMIDGCHSDFDIANKFANHFAEVFQQCNDSRSIDDGSQLPVKPGDLLAQVKPPCVSCLLYDVGNVCNSVTMDLVTQCADNITRGKACGPDNISIEHIIYSHPSVNKALCTFLNG